MQRWIHMEGGASWAIAPLPPHGSGTVPSSVRSAPSSLQFRRDLKTALHVSVIVLFAIVFGCMTDCNCNLYYCKVPLQRTCSWSVTLNSTLTLHYITLLCWCVVRPVDWQTAARVSGRGSGAVRSRAAAVRERLADAACPGRVSRWLHDRPAARRLTDDIRARRPAKSQPRRVRLVALEIHHRTGRWIHWLLGRPRLGIGFTFLCFYTLYFLTVYFCVCAYIHGDS